MEHNLNVESIADVTGARVKRSIVAECWEWGIGARMETATDGREVKDSIIAPGIGTPCPGQSVCLAFEHLLYI